MVNPGFMYHVKTHLNLNALVFEYEGDVLVCNTKVNLKVIAYVELQSSH